MRETQSYKAAQDPRRGLRKLPQRTEKGPQKGKKKKKLTNREESGSRLSNPFAFIFRVVRSSLLILANVNSRLKSIGSGVIFKSILTSE